MGRCLSKSMSTEKVWKKYGKKLLDTTKKLGTDAYKTASKRAIQTTTETSHGDLAGNKIAEKIGKTVSKSTHKGPIKSTKIPEQTSISKDTYIPSEKRQEIIHKC